ncbi:GNAT family N-acetyltransferase [Polluticoccus soli]|uniref:GNAT family N-acetyltransferase n=1 Tax=Polluticoccus soli TaxID=3034150 RepID=UPI0023E28C90|nr:GNAT family N-acetyltransferase [Flavipsychrobacter sp. JY13-12]
MLATLKIEPFTARLKDGTEVTIREATLQDASELMQSIRKYLSESEYQVMEQDEFSHLMSKGREWINAFIEEDNSLLLIAEVDGKIVGNLDITGGSRKRLRHNGLIGIGVLKQCHSQGLGSMLLQAGIDWAKDNPYLERLWMQIVDGNKEAIGLYKKLGFVEEGRQKNFIKTGEGTYADNIIMALVL